VVQLIANDGAHALHGGLDGFDRRLWQIAEIKDGAERSGRTSSTGWTASVIARPRA
jgi:galactose mutarotase-like enzyme